MIRSTSLQIALTSFITERRFLGGLFVDVACVNKELSLFSYRGCSSAFKRAEIIEMVVSVYLLFVVG